MNYKRKIILYIAASLDGYIARKNGKIDWLFSDQDYGYTEFIQRVDTILMGRKTYEEVLTFGEYPYKDKDCYVFSHTRKGRDENVKFIDNSVVEFSKEVKSKPGSNIWLVGGTGLNDDFLRNNLIDEYIISIHPILLGDGIPLFTKQDSEIQLVLTDSRKFSSGLVQLVYVRPI